MGGALSSPGKRPWCSDAAISRIRRVAWSSSSDSSSPSSSVKFRSRHSGCSTARCSVKLIS